MHRAPAAACRGALARHRARDPDQVGRSLQTEDQRMTIYYSRNDAKKHREFQMVPLKDTNTGVTTKAYRIICAECGAVEQRRRTNAAADDLFRKQGWEVGNNEKHDRCPACVKGKVIVMANHKKDEPAKVVLKAVPQAKEMSREDGRLISRSIEDHWDETNACYQMGWSDKKLADDLSVPLDWVKEIRERDFGGIGDDPTIIQFIAAQIEIKSEMAALSTLVEMASKDMKTTTSYHTELTSKLDGYLRGHRRLLDRVESLEQIASGLQPRKAG